jgi:excisionase family DNA binding protein
MVDRSPYLTVREVAAHFRVSEKTVYEMLTRDQLAYVRVGKSKGIRITRASVDALAASTEATA